MKNIIISIVVFSIILNTLMPLKSYGEELDENVLEEVVLKFKDLFAISNDYDKFVSRINSQEEELIFYLSWSDSKEVLPSINISTDSKGNLISYNKYSNQVSEQDIKLPKIEKNEALKLALDFVDKIDNNISKEVILKNSQNPMNIFDRYYNFTFIRYVNDIPYPLNSVYITIDMYTKEISNININWERNIDFPGTEGLISLEKAQKIYKDQIGLKLIYKQKHFGPIGKENEKDNRYFLAYSNLGEQKAIDAKTGEIVNIYNYGSYEKGYGGVMDNMSGNSELSIITPEEREEIDKVKGIKTIEEIEKKAREVLELDGSFILKRKNLYSNWILTDDLIYSLSFVKTVDNIDYSVEISINAKNLDLVSFYKYIDIDGKQKATIDKTKSLQLAKEFIKRINPDKSNQIELMEIGQDKGNNQVYNFNFIRKLDNIYVESDYISIGVDAVNKDIYSYSINWYKGEFPLKADRVSIDRAYDTLFNKIGYELNYIDLYSYVKDEQTKDIKLVYGVNSEKPLIIDAYTGNILDYMGNEYKEDIKYVYSDIDDSYAKDKINTLLEYNIGFESDKFRPKEKIQQKDFLYLLWKSMNPYISPLDGQIDSMYKELIRQGILKKGEEKREGVVTKEEAVKFVIRAMNYEKIAKINYIYKDLFSDSKDIEPELKGYVSLAYGLGVIEGDGSKYIRPKYELKREDGASIIYNYIFK